MATSIIALVCFIGLTTLRLAVVQLAAILPILLHIGLVLGTRACQATPAKCAPRSPGDHSEHRSIGPSAGRRCPRCRRNLGGSGRARTAYGLGRCLASYGVAAWPRGSGGLSAKGNRHVYYGPPVQAGWHLGLGRRRRLLLRLHSWNAPGDRCLAARNFGLSRSG